VDGRWVAGADNGDGAAGFAMVPTDRDGLVRAITDLGAG